MKTIATFCIALAAFLTCLTPAQAAVCAPHSKFKDSLGRKHHETVVAVGTVGNTLVMELYVSPEGSWTVLMTMMNGHSCLIAAGKNFQKLSPPVGKPS